MRPSRREVLAAAGTLALGAVVASGEAPADAPSEDQIVLSTTDLAASHAYVEWAVDPAASPLVAHLRETVAGFEGTDVAASAFLSSGTADVPRYVESATFANADAWPVVADATAAWFAARRDATATPVRREADVASWTVPAGVGTVDAVRLDRVEERLVLTVAGGAPDAALDPRAATRRYAAVVRGRVGGR